MNNRIVLLLAASALASCASHNAPENERAGVGSAATTAERREMVHAAPSSAATIDGYKRDLALHISQASSGKVYDGRPQALLRSVVVLKYVIDANGNLVRSEIHRSNRDRVTESTALATLKTAAPFPRPAPHLLRHGRLEVLETWLFNNDGRFQLRTIAQPQMDQ
ncbi:energy transducer TonB [Noviherbaspirillum cavernae]|uniref:Energy transducer TonB n=1 Tax=Noviherbaspirillum cavernae TaxID=2320862 RepID=A0A418X4Z5_9BURK|nr:energy transducer TonB [Noviherbaspirillum cavernae]RJG07553.1 energy transducer TonB [Noviherbaspirillum cavernae]